MPRLPLALVLALGCALSFGVTACRFGPGMEDATAFEYHEGSPPIAASWHSSLEGTLRDGTVQVTYRHVSYDEERTEPERREHTATLTGEDARRVAELVRATRLREPELCDGCSIPGVLLVNAEGDSLRGEPSNREAWQRLLRDVSEDTGSDGKADGG